MEEMIEYEDEYYLQEEGVKQVEHKGGRGAFLSPASLTCARIADVIRLWLLDNPRFR